MKRCACVLMIGVLSQAAVGAVTITNLGFPAVNSTNHASVVSAGVTDDGVAYGVQNQFLLMRYTSFVWTAQGGMESIGLEPSDPWQVIVGVAPGGRRMVMNTLDFSSCVSQSWYASVRSSDLPRVIHLGPARATTPDGRCVALEGGVWSVGTGYVPEPIPESENHVLLYGISDDGRSVLGHGLSQWGLRDESGDWHWIGTLGAVKTAILAGSGDVVIGELRLPDDHTQPYRWTPEEGFQHLDLPPGAAEFAYTTVDGCNAQADVIVGSVVGAGYEDEGSACIWVHGQFRFLKPCLEDLGVDLTGWTLDRALGISRNGRFIVGAGRYETRPGALENAIFLVDLQSPVTCRGDTDGDGVVTFEDITEVLAHWGATCP